MNRVITKVRAGYHVRNRVDKIGLSNVVEELDYIIDSNRAKEIVQDVEYRAIFGMTTCRKLNMIKALRQEWPMLGLADAKRLAEWLI